MFIYVNIRQMSLFLREIIDKNCKNVWKRGGYNKGLLVKNNTDEDLNVKSLSSARRENSNKRLIYIISPETTGSSQWLWVSLWPMLQREKNVTFTNTFVIQKKKSGILLPKLSDLLWEKIVLVIEKKICKIFEITRTIYPNNES